MLAWSQSRTIGLLGGALYLVALNLGSHGACATGVEDYRLTWERFEFFDRRDYAADIVTDLAGNIYVGGKTEEIYGQPDAGPESALAAKYSASGERLWLTLAYPDRGLDHVDGVAIDAANNFVIAGQNYRFGSEAFLVKYSPTGAVLWDRHLGSPDNEFGHDVAVDAAGNIYITGSTTGQVGPVRYGGYDPFIAKYSPDGTLQWAKQYPFHEFGYSISIDPAGDILLLSRSNLETSMARLDPAGNVLWSQEINYAEQPGQRTVLSYMTSDLAGNYYLAGFTNGVYDNGRGWQVNDAVVAKYASDGTLLWRRLLQTPQLDEAAAVTVDNAGNVYIGGATHGNLAANNLGSSDAFWAKYSPKGDLLHLTQFGSVATDFANGLAVDPQGRLYLTGAMMRDIGEYYIGDTDAYIARYDLVPEPGALGLAVIAGICVRRLSRSIIRR